MMPRIKALLAGVVTAFALAVFGLPSASAITNIDGYTIHSTTGSTSDIGTIADIGTMRIQSSGVAGTDLLSSNEGTFDMSHKIPMSYLVAISSKADHDLALEEVGASISRVSSSKRPPPT